MCYLSLLLPLLERCLASRDMTVAFCVWLLENYFRRVLVDGSLFISRCCNFFSAKEVVDKVNFVYYCCVTSVDFVCFVREVV